MLSPDIKIAYMFTGQGSQRVGMGIGSFENSPQAARIFQMADTIVSQISIDDRTVNLSSLCANGPFRTLTETQYTQPAVVAHDLAALAVAREIHPQLTETPPVFYLGHSVGEYAALAAAGVFDERTGIYFAFQRGKIMQEYGGRGTMAALFCDEEKALDICYRVKKEGDIGVEAVNLNGPLQTVVSGTTEEVGHVIDLAEDEDVVAKRLPVSHAFHHSVLMRPAQDRFREVLANIEFKDPLVPVILNVTGEPALTGPEIKAIMAQQIASPVQWHKSTLYLLEQGVNIFVEFGPQPILTGILKGINREARGICISDLTSAKNLRQALELNLPS